MRTLYLAAVMLMRGRITDADPIQPGYKWRTINGAKVLLDGNDNIVSGAGGKFNGKTMGKSFRSMSPMEFYGMTSNLSGKKALYAASEKFAQNPKFTQKKNFKCI